MLSAAHSNVKYFVLEEASQEAQACIGQCGGRSGRCVSTRIVSGQGRDSAMCKVQTRVAPEAQL
jgi:hypothetical protein